MLIGESLWGTKTGAGLRQKKDRRREKTEEKHEKEIMGKQREGR